MRFSAYLLFAIGWFMFVYVPLAHWVWGGGFLGGAGVIDFAGGPWHGIVIGMIAGMLCFWACTSLKQRFK
jgi:Amt family ammonium transporter